MNQLRTLLSEQHWSVLVSLPRNDLELARSALEAGARGLKVHVNVDHFASGTHYGTWAEERGALEPICALAANFDANVGIVAGAGGAFASVSDFAEMAVVGIDYFDAYPADTPAWVFEQEHLDIMLAAYAGYNLSEFAHLEQLGMTLCEASILSHEQYGAPLNAEDLSRYAHLCQVLTVPVIVPSQKKLVPADAIALHRAGARAALLGAIVTGTSVESVSAAVASFCAV